MESGTLSEVFYGIVYNKKIILVGLYDEANIFFQKLPNNKNIYIFKYYIEAIKILNTINL